MNCKNCGNPLREAFAGRDDVLPVLRGERCERTGAFAGGVAAVGAAAAFTVCGTVCARRTRAARR